MLDVDHRTPENGNSPAENEAHEESVDPSSPKSNGWERRKLIDQLDNDMKKLLQIEEIYQRLVKARELVANGSVRWTPLLRQHEG